MVSLGVSLGNYTIRVCIIIINCLVDTVQGVPVEISGIHLLDLEEFLVSVDVCVDRITRFPSRSRSEVK